MPIVDHPPKPKLDLDMTIKSVIHLLDFVSRGNTLSLQEHSDEPGSSLLELHFDKLCKQNSSPYMGLPFPKSFATMILSAPKLDSLARLTFKLQF